MSAGMMRFNGDNGIGCFWSGSALLALSPAPAPGNYQAGFIGENDFAWLWMFYCGLT